MLDWIQSLLGNIFGCMHVKEHRDAKCKKEVSFYHKNEKYSEKFRDSSLIIFFLWKANMGAYYITNAFLKISITNPKSK